MRPIRTVIVVALAVAFVAAPVAAASESPQFLTPNLVQNPGAELGDSAQGGFVPSIPSWRPEQRRPTVVRYGAPGFPTVAQGAAVGGGAAFFAGGPADGRDDDTPAFSRVTTVQVVPILDELDFQRESGQATYNDGYADNLSVRVALADGSEPETSCAFDAPPVPVGSVPSPGSPEAAKPVAVGGSPAAASSSTGGTNTAVPLTRVGDRIRFRHGRAALKLRCAARDGACAGSISLKTRLGRLGSARFKIGAGKVGTIDVRIGRKMRRRLAALSRARLAKLEVTATARLGTATTTFVYRAAP